VLDMEGEFARYCNMAMVDLESVASESEQQSRVPRDLWHMGLADEIIAKRLLEKHAKYTGSFLARQLLDEWSRYRGRFVKVFPKEYRRALGELAMNGKKVAA
jgi:glutamate synthase (NADPH/NADH) large chain